MALTYPQPILAGIYCRLSYAPDGSLEKVERQEGDCRELGARLKWPISEFHIFRDNSRSAWQRKRKRPAWEQMLQAIEAGEINAMLIYHGDRLIRQPHDLETLINISDSRGIRIASPSGTRSLDSPDDRFILRIEAAQACRESDNTSRRVQRAMDSRLERGLTNTGGRRPFGYGLENGTRLKQGSDGKVSEVPFLDTTLQVPEEATLLADAVERLLAGQSQNGVVRWLNTRCTTTEGNAWTAKSLRNVVLSPRVAALIERDGALYPAAWDSIISEEAWVDLKSLFKDNAAANPYPGRERRYLLSGAQGAQCGLCQAFMRTKPSGGRNRKTSRIYHCHDCRKTGRNVELLDAYVEGKAVALLNDARFLEELVSRQSADTPSPSAEIAALERRKREVTEQLKNLANHPEVDAGLAFAALASFDEKITALRVAAAAAADHQLLARMAGITPERWRDTALDVRSATVRQLFQVIVHPTARRGPGFDPDTVQVLRRSGPGNGPA